MGRVLAPVNGKGAARALVEAGATELYMGFYDAAWTNAFGAQAALNRMSGFGQDANALSFEELLAEVQPLLQPSPTVDAATAAGSTATAAAAPDVHAFCVFNAARYSSEQLDFIAAQYLPRLAEAGFTGVILSGPQLVEAAHACGLYAVASTMCAIYNEDLARYYRSCGMDRIILPRDVSLGSIGAIMQAVPDLDYEVFLMRNGCIFADSHCMGLHKADRPALCRTLRSAACWNQLGSLADAGSFDAESFWENDRTYKDRFHLNTCGQCALWRFEQLGVSAYKVVGRCDNLSDLCDDVRLTAQNVRIAQACATEEEFLHAMERPADLLELCANEGLSCYYPEPRFGS